MRKAVIMLLAAQTKPPGRDKARTALVIPRWLERCGSLILVRIAVVAVLLPVTGCASPAGAPTKQYDACALPPAVLEAFGVSSDTITFATTAEPGEQCLYRSTLLRKDSRPTLVVTEFPRNRDVARLAAAFGFGYPTVGSRSTASGLTVQVDADLGQVSMVCHTSTDMWYVAAVGTANDRSFELFGRQLHCTQ